MTYTWNTSVGIWAFGISPTRFMPGGYHPEVADLDVVERLKRAVDGLGPLVKGYEFHYETEIDERNLEQIRTVLGRDHRIATICYGLVPNPRFQLGALINPDPGKRREAVAHMKRAIDMAAEVGARFIYWPGNEGYNYSFQRDYATTWGWFLEGIQETVEHANKKNVIYLLEHKNSEPAMQILMRNVASAMFIVKKIAEMGTDTRNLKINMDWQHLIMNNEPLPEYAALLAREGLLGHQHGNSGWGAFDDDNMVGASFFWQTVELAKVLQQVKYGANGEWLGLDLFPYTEDPVAAVRRSVLQWQFISDIAEKIGDEELAAAHERADAVAAYTAVFKALGLDEAYERRIVDLYARR
ncbi:MAG: TIM barrel protein [Symbiobacterium sp.]|uniref:sugar phosphate isomerase/epimerase family protein n=1 Tax=Symbiobacterium sp. TaxID=1971213 RepID=UPI003464B0A2